MHNRSIEHLNSTPVLVVMGTTASGKTGLAEGLADQLGARLINADAFQVYRHLDIGTAKSERKGEYALIDIRDPRESFGVGEWVRLVAEELHRLPTLRQPAVIVGGTGLYIRALTAGYGEMAEAPDPELREELNALSLEELLPRLEKLDSAAYERVDRQNRVRVQRAVERALTPGKMTPPELPPVKFVKIALNRDPEEVRNRIADRVRDMASAGWAEEVRSLIQMGYSHDDPGLRAHGYRHIWDAVQGTMTMEQALDLTTAEVRRYARRQRTWLRKEPGLIWVEPDDPQTLAMLRMKLIEE